MTENVNLPIVIGGRLFHVGELPNNHLLNYESGLTITVPALDHEHIDAIKASRASLMRELCRLDTYEVTKLLSAVGRRWLDPKNPTRQQAAVDAAKVTGYSQRLVSTDYEFIGAWLSQRPFTYDYIKWELGNERILDEWCRVENAWVRAFPQGIVFHSMVGNMMLANAFTLLWGCITKNINLAKVPARDPVTPLALAQTFVEVDATHPLTRALTAGYWGHKSTLLDAACDAANVIFAWGSGAAIKQIKEKAPAGASVVEFGPKWSLAVIDTEQCDVEMAAWRMAADVTFYDQEACLSPQRVFIKGACDQFIERLAHYLDRAAKHIPKEAVSRDAQAHFAMNRLEASFRGWKMRSGHDWTIIEVADPTEVIDHPLGRTLFVHPIADLDAVSRYLTPLAQTLCCEPWVLSEKYRDDWAAGGVVRIVELGMSKRPRDGYSHDGMRPLSKLVRWVTCEGSIRHISKYNVMGPEQIEDMLFPWREQQTAAP